MRCVDCPIAEGSPCVAARPGYGWACKLAADSDAGRRWVCMTSSSMPPESTPVAARVAAPNSPDLAEDLALLKRARDCRHKVVPTCGCRYGSCTRLGRDVSPRDCLDCLRAGRDAIPEL